MTSTKKIERKTTDISGMAAQALGFELLRTTASTKIQHKSKSLSHELEQKIDIANKQWGKAKESVLEVYNQALKDGWTEVQAAKICRERLTIFSPRTIRGILPDEAKNQTMKRVGGYKQIAESLPQLTSDSVVTMEKKRSEVGKQIQEHQDLSNTTTEYRPSKSNKDFVSEQENTKEEEEEQSEIYQIDIKEYLLEDLPKYSKPLLIKIVGYLDKQIDQSLGAMMKLENEIDRLKEENKKQQKRIAELEGRV